MNDVCSCGADVTSAEIRVVERCARGHFVRSSVSPAKIASATLAPRPITPGQIRGLAGKSNRLDRAREVPLGTTKQQLLAKHGYASMKQLDEVQASLLLDELEQEIQSLA